MKLTGRRLLLDDEAADVPGDAADARRLAHVGPGVRVADRPYGQPRPVAHDLELVLVALLLVQRLVVLQPLDPRQRLPDHVAAHRRLLARTLGLQPRRHAHLRYRFWMIIEIWMIIKGSETFYRLLYYGLRRPLGARPIVPELRPGRLSEMFNRTFNGHRCFGMCSPSSSTTVNSTIDNCHDRDPCISGWSLASDNIHKICMATFNFNEEKCNRYCK
jgi:hypothetical protein